MRNLVWTFWLALILSIIGTFIASVFLMRQWSNFVSYSEMEGPNNFNFRFLAISREIENTLNKNGNLETLLLDHPIKDFAEIYLIDQEGIDALGEVTIRIRNNNKIYSGHSADTDVVVAAANAYVNALNRLVFSEKKNSIHPQLDNLDNTEKTFLSNPSK